MPDTGARIGVRVAYPSAMSVLLIGAALALCSCHPPLESSDEVTDLARMPYPAQVQQGEDLAIVLRRTGDHIEVTNTTAQSYENVWMWLNQRYVGQIDLLTLGTGNRYDLGRFVNSHGERYPRGGFLKPDKSFPIILAELYDPRAQRKHRLLVRMGRE